METKFLNESTVMINGTTWSITEPVLSNLGTDGEVAFFSKATHTDKEGDVNEIDIHWPSETGEWDDLNEDDFYVAYQDQYTLNEILSDARPFKEMEIKNLSTNGGVTATVNGVDGVFTVSDPYDKKNPCRVLFNGEDIEEELRKHDPSCLEHIKQNAIDCHVLDMLCDNSN